MRDPVLTDAARLLRSAARLLAKAADESGAAKAVKLASAKIHIYAVLARIEGSAP